MTPIAWLLLAVLIGLMLFAVVHYAVRTAIKGARHDRIKSETAPATK